MNESELTREVPEDESHDRIAIGGAAPTPQSVGAVESPAVGAYLTKELKFPSTDPYYGVNFIVKICCCKRRVSVSTRAAMGMPMIL